MEKTKLQRLYELMNKVGGMPLSEVDWEGEFADVKQKCLNVEEFKDYLNKVLENYRLPTHKRKKLPLYVHNKTIPFDEEGEIDVQSFINKITEKPKSIVVGGNIKMQKSAGDDFYTVSIGIPAFRGLVYDLENKTFHVVNTCPGAGTCVTPCYGRRGRFVLLTDVYLKQTKVLNWLLNYPEEFKKNLKEEIITLYKKNLKKGKSEMRFRWNETGDFFSEKYFQIGVDIMKELVEEGYLVKPYAHTKIADIYNLKRSPDFVVSFSVDATPKEVQKMDLEKAKTSEIVDRKHFKDLFVLEKNKYVFDDKGKPKFKDPINGENILKKRIADAFNVDIKTLLSHDEMLNTPESDTPKYNVFILPQGETDISTQRKDIMRTFFLEH